MSSQLTNNDKGRVKTRRFNKKIHVREKRREAKNVEGEKPLYNRFKDGIVD